MYIQNPDSAIATRISEIQTLFPCFLYVSQRLVFHHPLPILVSRGSTYPDSTDSTTRLRSRPFHFASSSLLCNGISCLWCNDVVRMPRNPEGGRKVGDHCVEGTEKWKNRARGIPRWEWEWRKKGCDKSGSAERGEDSKWKRKVAVEAKGCSMRAETKLGNVS